MKKRYAWLIIVIVIASVTILSIRLGEHILGSSTAKTTNNMAGISTANRIVALDGANGNIVEISNFDDIEQILYYTANITLEKAEKEPAGGYDYYLDYYDGEKYLARITFSGEWMDINGTDYLVREDNNKISIVKLMSGYFGKESLPPTRWGTEEKITAQPDKVYTFETAFAESDMVARIKIGDWIAEEEDDPITYYEVDVIEMYKGEALGKIVLLQTGNSKQTIHGYPLFTDGNEFIVFLSEVEETEYEDAYKLLGEYTTLFDIVELEDGEAYVLDRSDILGEGITGIKNYSSDEELYWTVRQKLISNDEVFANIEARYQYMFSLSDVEVLMSEQNN